MKINYIFLFIFNFQIILCNAFTIYKIFPELCQDFRAEKIVYDLLRKKPINKDITFVFAPWTNLERNTRANRHPNISDLGNLKFENAFTVCSFDEYENLIPYFKSIGIKVVFSASGNSNKFDDIEIITIPYSIRNDIKPNRKKDILYSFIGNIKTHSCRKKIFEMQHPKNSVVIKREMFHYNTPDIKLLEKNTKEYADILSRSRFSLCPRGISAGSYRFWESLNAGAIPVLISDDYVLPSGFNWDSCIVRIKENEIYNLLQKLSSISPKQEKQMRKQCLIAYKQFSGNNFDKIIREYYK